MNFVQQLKKDNFRMLSRPILNTLRSRKVSEVLVKSLSINIPALQKASDPIQQLFVDKVREYGQKSKSAGGKLVDASPEIQKEMASELDRIAKQYGGGKGVDMTQFPSFKFTDPTIDPINLQSS
ncbi:hypothetical protein B566_EDAN008936 [Ephemera danica]|nr:hypothetical protein B566_EDAN008936 [Ephemera danica]